jgi:uncharacterized membrane protein
VLMLKPTRWLEIIVFYTIITMAIVYLIPSDSPFIAVRIVLGFVFVVFLPGYCLVNIMFLGRNRLDVVESLVLSVALSWGITGLVGLFLGLSFIGITFLPITVMLSVVTLVLAVIAFVRKTREPKATQPQPVEQEVVAASL